MSRGQPKYSGALSDLYPGYAKKWYDHLIISMTRLPNFSWKFRAMLDKYGIKGINDVASQLREAGVKRPSVETTTFRHEGKGLYLFPVIHKSSRFSNLREAEEFLAWKGDMVMAKVPYHSGGKVEVQDKLVFKDTAEQIEKDPAGAVWDRLQASSDFNRDDDIKKMLVVGSYPFTSSLSNKYKRTSSDYCGKPQEALHWLFSYHELSVASVTELVVQTKQMLKDVETMLAELKHNQVDPKERFLESLPMAAIDPSGLLPGASSDLKILVKMGASYLLEK